MSSIHESLKALGPVTFTDVPQDQDGLKNYLVEHLSAGKFLIESIPQPVQPSSGRSRAVSSASSSADIASSSARTETPSEHESLQRDWGKPIKLSEKDNPLGISVFKLAGKDGKGAWFARRSVHEGLSFAKWKKGLQEEFEHSLQIQGGPGSGKVRGLGAEQRPESHQVEGVGTLDVWHVSAQFPGPSAPRDFVSLVMTSDTVLEQNSPRHFMVVSTPCEHDNCPPQDGLVRGRYESVEFIREIPRSMKAASTTDLTDITNSKSNDAASRDKESSSPGRIRGRTIAFAESRGHKAKGESIDISADEVDPAPVEWIMITRSDPGGSVPRFLVERGTPGGIVSDASKFLDWACQRDLVPAKEQSTAGSQQNSTMKDLANGESESKADPEPKNSVQSSADQDIKQPIESTEGTEPAEPGILSAVSTAAQAMLQKVTGPPVEDPKQGDHTNSLRSASISSSTSSVSYASAEEDLSITHSLHSISEKSTSSSKPSLSAQEKELVRLANRKAELSAKLQSAHDKAFRDPTAPTDKEKSWLAKTQQKHDRELEKAEDRYTKAIRNIEDKRLREEEKAQAAREHAAKREADKKRKAEQKEKDKVERDQLKEQDSKHRAEVVKFREEIKGLQEERERLREDVRVLQGENMRLVTMMGKLDGGERLLQELKSQS